MKFILASSNAHKVDEIKAILSADAEILSLEDIGCDDDIPETGDTFEENAHLKSDYIFERYGGNVLADDSGLEVEALHGEPGVYSARYSGSRDMERNIDLLLERLGDNPNRRARFRTVIALIMDGKRYTFEGTVNGIITDGSRRGTAGFGYDPIFIPEGYEQTFAEMLPEEKNRISHRARALTGLSEFLSSQH